MDKPSAHAIIRQVGPMERGQEIIPAVCITHEEQGWLPERENMAYQSQMEALGQCFGQETDMGKALQELATLKQGKIQYIVSSHG